MCTHSSDQFPAHRRATTTATGGDGVAAPPVVVYASTIAVYGSALPEVVTPHTPLRPPLIYGAHKLACEVLLADFSRRGRLDGRALRQLLGNALAASVFSAFLVLPAIWLGNGSNVLLIPCKTFLTVAALGLLTRFLPWNQLTAAMRVFHLPQVVIFIFDTTLRYIVLLGEIAGEMLTALKLRSIGHNPHKGRAISGILGVMFLRSREMSEEMYQAMVCRGYTGEYLVAAARGRHRGGFWLALLFLLFVMLYLRIEVLL